MNTHIHTLTHAESCWHSSASERKRCGLVALRVSLLWNIPALYCLFCISSRTNTYRAVIWQDQDCNHCAWAFLKCSDFFSLKTRSMLLRKKVCTKQIQKKIKSIWRFYTSQQQTIINRLSCFKCLTGLHDENSRWPQFKICVQVWREAGK